VERNLATELNVSRVPVREALRDLVAEGYAAPRPTGGVAVRSYPAAEIDELFQIRTALETILVERAVADLPTQELNRLRDSLTPAREALAAADRAAAITANVRFHEVLEEVAAGPLLRGLLSGIRDRMKWLLRQHDDPVMIAAEHEALVAAIAAGNRFEAQRLLLAHLATSRAALANR
jgi:DNA-binding GntR family transcriptional regulator